MIDDLDGESGPDSIVFVEVTDPGIGPSVRKLCDIQQEETSSFEFWQLNQAFITSKLSLNARCVA